MSEGLKTFLWWIPGFLISWGVGTWLIHVTGSVTLGVLVSLSGGALAMLAAMELAERSGQPHD